MVIKLSDYILEQSISSASIDDIGLEQLVAEMDVCCKLAMAYNKQLLMESYFQEAKQEPQFNSSMTGAISGEQPQQQTTSSQDGFFATILNYIKRFFAWVGSKLVSVAGDAAKNKKFIDYYVMNTTEANLFNFINSHGGMDVERFNPETVGNYIKGLVDASLELRNELEKAIGIIIQPNEDSVNKCVEVMNSAMTKFNTTINQIKPQQPAITDRSLTVEQRVEIINKFKGYVPGFTAAYSNNKKSFDTITSNLNYCGNCITKITAETMSKKKNTITVNKKNVAVKDVQTNINSITDEQQKTQLKQALVNLQKSAQTGSQAIAELAKAYSDLKQFATELATYQKENPNETTGTVQQKEVPVTN